MNSNHNNPEEKYPFLYYLSPPEYRRLYLDGESDAKSLEINDNLFKCSTKLAKVPLQDFVIFLVEVLKNKMKETIKNILIELIEYHSSRSAKGYLKKAQDELGNEGMHSLIGFLLNWPYKESLNLASSSSFELNDTLKMRYVNLFNLTPELKTIFLINENQMNWSPNLSEVEKDKVKKYILENHNVTVRVRRRSE